MKAAVVKVVVAVKDFVVAHPQLVVGLVAGVVIGVLI
jgi:hypothetical protein